MTEDNYFKAQRIRELIINMESTLRMVSNKCKIHAYTSGEGGGYDYNLSEDKDIDATIRKGMADALEKRIKELKQEFQEL